MLNPINIAGPDQRRKQLMQKLSQQAGQRGPVPMPPGSHGSAAALGAGTSFRASGLRTNASVQTTSGGNVLANILARLGVGGRPQNNELNSGFGSAISQYGPHYTPPPAADPGNPIPAGGSASPPGLGQHLTAAQGSAYTGPAIGQPGGLPYGTTIDSGIPGAPPVPFNSPDQSPNADVLQMGGGNRVPLGGGLYYDPSTGTVVNLGSGMGAAALLGGVGHSAI